MKLILLSFWVLASLWHTTFATQPTVAELADSREARLWADSVYNTLTEKQRIAQLVFPKVDPRGGANSKALIRKLVETNGVGGLLFSGGSIEQYVDMINYAQSVARIPLIITFDGEWGLSMRIPGTPRFPHNMALGATDDYDLIYDYGRESARQFRTMGVQVNFAPDADINSNPANPVIGYRSFGEDPDRVAQHVVAYSRGLEEGGVQSVAKHFPGHGDTSTDSHKALPTVGHSRAMLDSVDLVPFRAYIDDNLSGIMVGHLSVPSLDPSGTPASLSEKITTGLLRGEMGFKGLIYTDALGMKGADSKSNNSLMALKAGADVLLCPSNPISDIGVIAGAIHDGSITAATVEQRCKKVLAYKFALGLSSRPAPVSLSAVKALAESPEADEVLRRLAAASITVLRNNDGILPIGNLSGKKIAVVNIGDQGKDFTGICSKYADITIETTATDSKPLGQGTIAKLRDCDIVIAAVYNDSQASRAALASLSGCKNVIEVFFMNPYRAAKFGTTLANAPTVVFAYDDTRYQREYAAQAVFGGIRVDGHLPVNLKGIAPAGTGVCLPKTRLGYTSPMMEGMRPGLTARIDSLIGVGLSTGAFPGAQVIVAKGGNIVVDRSYGFTDASKRTAVTDATVYDLASVSKAIGTLPGIMKAYDLGMLDIDAPAAKYIPQLADNGKGDITVRELLFHQSGMPASADMLKIMIDTTSYSGKLTSRRPDKTHTIKISRNLYGHKDARLRSDLVSSAPTGRFGIKIADGMYVGQHTYDTIMSRIYAMDRRPTKEYLYSCVNFCLLMNIEQNITRRPHDLWVSDSIFAPIGAYSTCYRPLTCFNAVEVAPTENDRFMRRQIVHGYVHDETAAFSGGVQGNAGLFSNAGDLAKICQMWLNGGTYGGVRVLSAETVAKFTTEHSDISRRGLGFDKPDTANPDKSPTCASAPAETYGHIGFTGTVFWVDPVNELIFIFLNNRVNPTRDNKAFSTLDPRPKLFQLVYDSLQ